MNIRLTGAQVDREAIEDYAARTYHKNLSKAIAANTTPIPNQTELWMVSYAKVNPPLSSHS